MGIAILMVIYFHSGFSSNIEILKTIRTFCYCGVDIFLFASGIGNYFSYFKACYFAGLFRRVKIKPLSCV